MNFLNKKSLLCIDKHTKIMNKSIKINSIVKEKKYIYENTINFGIFDSKFGKILIACESETENIVSIHLNKSENELINLLMNDLKPKIVIRNDNFLSEIFKNVFYPQYSENLKIKLIGSKFEINVWEELIRIPEGQTRTYSQIASNIGSPKSVRAVASAIARNRIAILIPCHRVISKSGKINNYRWGVETKKKLIESENGILQ